MNGPTYPRTGPAADGPGPALAALIAAYDGHAHRLLSAVADQLQLSLAYVDRAIVEAHLEHSLADSEWAAAVEQFHAMSFDAYVGDHGTLRTDWINNVLDTAGVTHHGQIRAECRQCQRSEPRRAS